MLLAYSRHLIIIRLNAISMRYTKPPHHVSIKVFWSPTVSLPAETRPRLPPRCLGLYRDYPGCSPQSASTYALIPTLCQTLSALAGTWPRPPLSCLVFHKEDPDC